MKNTGMLLICLIIVLVTGCGKDTGTKKSDKIYVTATTGMVAEIAKKVGGDRVEVTALMGPGVDPHLYKASQGDIAKLTQADLILYNGLNLEGKMEDVFKKMAQRGKRTLAVTSKVDKSHLLAPPEFAGHYDPHLWFDVQLWSQTVQTVVDALIQLEETSKQVFEANGERYQEELEALHAYCKERIETIPKEGRVLVTAHDAFGYFGKAYDIEVVGLQGITTSSEYGLKDVHGLVNFIIERKVKAVYVESSVPKRSIEAVVEGCKAREHMVIIGGTLFSDAMGEAGTPEGTYNGMVRHNVEAIVTGLK